jgi:hypothetical protein
LDEVLEVPLVRLQEKVSLRFEMLMEFAREQTWSGVEVDDGASLVLLQRWGQIADDIVYT